METKYFTELRVKKTSEVPKKENEWLSTLEKLVEKATPKKPKIEKHPYSIDYESSLADKYFCPNCNQFLREVAGYHLNKNYCPYCGQALDWS